MLFHSPFFKRCIALLTSSLLLFQLTFSSAWALDLALPEIGDPSGNLLTPTEEQRLGRAFMRSIRNSMKVISDPLLDQYIRSLGTKLVGGSGALGTEFHFFMVDNPQINAFAGPGGHIGIYTGLITTTESESELASVIAHEIAHVTQKHLFRSFDAAQRLSLPATALAIAALVIGAATKNAQAGAVAASGIQAGMIQSQINFTRSNEEEADHVGIKTLADSGFEPRSMPTFFTRMGKNNRLYDSGQLPEFLRTHPVSTNRTADAVGRAEEYPYRQKPDSLGYHLSRARLKMASFESADDGVIYFSKTLKDGRYRNKTAQQYGYSLSLIENRQYSTAEQILNELNQKYPEQVEFIVASANLKKAMGQPQAGLTRLQQGLALHPDNYPLTLYAAQLLLDIGKPTEALKMLRRYIDDRPDELELYKLLAQAAGDSGDKTQGHRYLAEYYYLSGALKLAQQHLESALKDRSLDYYQSAKITARLKGIRQEQADLDGRKR